VLSGARRPTAVSVNLREEAPDTPAGCSYADIKAAIQERISPTRLAPLVRLSGDLLKEIWTRLRIGGS
jgi:hypothetical protein